MTTPPLTLTTLQAARATTFADLTRLAREYEQVSSSAVKQPLSRRMDAADALANAVLAYNTDPVVIDTRLLAAAQRDLVSATERLATVTARLADAQVAGHVDEDGAA